MGERACVICGESLDGRRSDAEVCGAACRRERSRLSALLRGDSDGPYRNLRQYAERPRRRAKRATAGVG
jgi:hypothetical protein